MVTPAKNHLLNPAEYQTLQEAQEMGTGRVSVSEQHGLDPQ